MSFERISFEWRFVNGSAGQAGHMYIVARNAGETDGDGVVIDGNPSLYGTVGWWNATVGDYGTLAVNAGAGAGGTLATSVDAYLADTEASRNDQNISSDFAGSLDTAWANMCTIANDIASANFAYDPAQIMPPLGPGLNSNTLIATVLSYQGINIDDVLATYSAPFFGWPGKDTLLSVEANSYVRGWGGDDTFFEMAGGNTLAGGDGTNLVATDATDGSDTVIFRSATPDIEFVNDGSGHSHWNVILTNGGTIEESSDTLYSVEFAGTGYFSTRTLVNMQGASAGTVFQDRSQADLESIGSQDGLTLTDAVEITNGSVDFTALNIGRFTGTNSNDTFVLNALLDRTFDGAGGTDTVDFSGYAGGGMIINLENSLAQHPLVIAGAVPEVPQSATLLHIENAIGTIHSDTIVGADGVNTLTGGQGNDQLSGGASGDTFVFHVGDGNDVITDYNQGEGDKLQYTGGVVEANISFSKSGNDEIVHDGSDTVILQNFFTEAAHSTVTVVFDSGTVNFTIGSDGTAADLANQTPAAEGPGGTGITLTGTTGDDYLKGSDAADAFNATQTGNDTIEGHGGNDQISAGSGNDHISGGDGADNITTGNGNNWIDGGAGNDVISTGTGNNVVSGGDGDDSITLSGTGTNTIDGGTGNDTVHVAGTQSVVDGGDGNDTILSSGNGSTLTGGAGDDSIVTDGGSDVVIDGAGQDNYHLETGSTATVFAAADGAVDTFMDDEDTGTLDLSASGNGVTLTEYTGSANNLISSDLGDGKVSGFKHIFGSQGDDSFVGSTAASPSVFTSALTAEGGTGNDYFENVVGSMVGGTGADTFVGNVFGEIGGKVQDYSVLEGDILSLKGLATAYTQNAADLAHLHGVASGNDLNLNVLPFGVGGGGEQTLLTLHNFFSQPSSTEKIVIDFTDDSLGTIALNVASDGTLSQDTLTTGTSGDDTLAGTSSTDAMLGFAGNDTLTGGAGSDTLDGGTGTDSMTGGTGDDTYILDSTFDVIVENSGEGTDTALASDSYTLSSNVENLVLTGNSAIDGTGNSLDNIITGNASDNTLTGGSGSDTYIIGNTGGHDVIADSAGTLDTIQFDSTVSSSSVSYVRSGDDLVVVYGTGGGSVVVSGFFTSGDSIEQITFSDSTVHNASYINAHLLNAFGTSGDDNLAGTNADDTLTGLAGNDTITALAGDDTLDGGTGADTLIGGTGDDVYIVDNTGDVVTENSGEGTDTIQSSVTYALPTNVENLTLTGTGDINGTGNSAVNIITGNSGNNVLDGGAGADTLTGGGGNDTFIVDNSGDVVTASTGTDTIQSSITWDMSASGHNNADVENLVLTGSANINGTGNSLDNIITSNTGRDTLTGGLGNDTYIVNNTADSVIENSGEGTDTVQASISFTLGSNVENLVLTGSANIDGTGNIGNNVITGNTGDNTLTGGGGTDTLIGGGGNDNFVVAATTVTITAGSGNDTIQSFVTWDMSASGHNNSDVENLTLLGSSNLNATGNSLDNIITSNSGIDTLAGGLGNDTYIVNNSSDVVVENAGEGTDTIVTTTTYTLPTNFENLTATGTGNVTLTGSSGDNILTSNTGVDLLNGGDGNDTYFVNNTNDSITDTSGTDWLEGTVNLALGSGNFLENLTLLGTANINGTGNALANILNGNSGNNSLTGGTGADTMTGGLGDDTYFVDNTGDIVTENAGEGTDTVSSSITYTLGSNVEDLILTGGVGVNGVGNSLDNVLSYTNTSVHSLVGGLGDDTYIVTKGTDVIIENSGEGTDTIDLNTAAGSGTTTITMAANVENLILIGAGNTNTVTGNSLANVITDNSTVTHVTLTGGNGDDTYVVNSASDAIVESSGTGTGTDTVISNLTWTLGTNLENLILTGTANINGTGNTANNILTGNDGNNSLDGSTGVDTLIGGLGDDVFTVRNASDVVTEYSGEGNDTISSTVSYILPNYVENLTLSGSTVLVGTGNSLDNTMTGNSAADTLSGGTGDDTYVISNISTVVIENSGEGTDTVTVTASTGSYTLANNIEHGALTTGGNIVGNALDNVINGGNASNTLDGGAGNDTLWGGTLGTDTLIGGSGNDTFIVDRTTGISITEASGGGTDTVQSSVTYTLSSTQELENLTLTGTSAINGTGNGLNNTIIGNTAVNVLSGGSGNDTLDGGDGVDTMTGGTGTDLFMFHAATAFHNADAITDFSTSEGDKINIADLLSGHYNPGTDNIDNFVILSGTALRVDVNGSGNAFAPIVAELNGTSGLNVDTLIANGELIVS